MRDGAGFRRPVGAGALGGGGHPLGLPLGQIRAAAAFVTPFRRPSRRGAVRRLPWRVTEKKVNSFLKSCAYYVV